MSKFKTITALLLTGILTLSLLTACGNSTSSDHADSSTAGPSQIVSSAQGGQQSSPEETSDGLVVTTAGKVQGTLNDGVYTYLGVPYLDAVRSIIETQGATAEYAASVTGENFSAAFAAMEDEYMRARAADVKDISRRVVNVLTGQEDGSSQDDQPVILVADDLTPSETVQLDKSKLLGFITRYGSSNSHTAILARTMNIPALIGVDFDESWDGQLAVLDGYNHCVYIDPAQELLSAMTEKRQSDLKQEALLQSLKKKANVTLDGREIKVYANIGSGGDVGLVLQNDAQGIGLFRSEFLYLDS